MDARLQQLKRDYITNPTWEGLEHYFHHKSRISDEDSDVGRGINAVLGRDLTWCELEIENLGSSETIYVDATEDYISRLLVLRGWQVKSSSSYLPGGTNNYCLEKQLDHFRPECIFIRCASSIESVRFFYNRMSGEPYASMREAAERKQISVIYVNYGKYKDGGYARLGE